MRSNIPLFNPPSRSLRTLTIKLQRQRADEKSGLIPRCSASKTWVQGSTLGFHTSYYFFGRILACIITHLRPRMQPGSGAGVHNNRDIFVLY